MLWYFIEGFNNRKGDYPYASKKEYDRFTVLINEGEHELIFYRSNLSERLWIEVQVKAGNTSMDSERHHLIPCSYEDYQRACENDIPLRWWLALKKSV